MLVLFAVGWWVVPAGQAQNEDDRIAVLKDQIQAMDRVVEATKDAVCEPKIYTSIADSGVVLSLFYVAHYRDFSALRARLSQRILVELGAHREVQLAYPTLSILKSDSNPPQAPEGNR